MNTPKIITILIFFTHPNNVRAAAYTHPHITSTHPNRRISNRAAATTHSWTPLRMSHHKDSDRAHIEQHLEDMMGDDWRLFRAKLVAQEQQDGDTMKGKTAERSLGANDDNFNFFDAISSMFSPSHEPSSSDRESSSSDEKNSPRIHEDIMAKYDELCNGDDKISCDDPFATPEEAMGLFNAPKMNISKHRWAHPIPHVEQGCVLVASEKLAGVFHQTVVLVIDHHDMLGSTGIIINRPYPGNFMKVASETPSNVDTSLKLAFHKSPVTFGGPVMKDDYSVLHGYGEVDGSKKVAPGIFVGGSRELMNQLRKNNFDSREALFVKGHASWIKSQLSKEVEKGVWYVTSVSHDFILRYAGAPMEEGDNPDDLWSDILTCMGGKYKKIAEKHGKRGDKRMSP
eukprot:CAMPEP_0172482762 /NCGR_PEP_ID=MMETSP1066-20121228/9365_1 /TAXON_ID=671091 /ORGANISM="Coscinodiscus wailesii, Strain CCMP2513" /LENGTH=398 /DNA_ID=CAMNT_0013246157 /DNA_START=138 /DNA_END=1334 /DNA_ORIENTATION=+